jgi:hypothetical protein
MRQILSGHMNVNNEVEMFQVFRYLSAGEAFYRTVNFDMHYSDVGCTRLSCHLEGKDWVGKESAGEASRLLAYFKRPTPLADLRFTEYFARFNVSAAKEADLATHAEDDGEDDDLYEPEVGSAAPFYIDTCNPPNKVAQRRGLHVARMYPVPVTQGELYYLRLLLANFPVTSYAELRTHNDVTYATYREAAEARGLLTVEKEFVEALGRDVIQRQHNTPCDLRYTFVMMVLQGGEGVPVLDLYERFKYYMATDITIAGQARSPGVDADAVFQRLDHSEWDAYDADAAEEEGFAAPHLGDHPVHEYHLLKMLEKLIADNSTRSMEDIGLPDPRAFAQRRSAGHRTPDVQHFLEAALYVSANAILPADAVSKELVRFLRGHYIKNFPDLLTGPALSPLLSGAARAEALANFDFVVEVDVAAEDARFKEMYATLNAEQKVFADKAIEGLQYQALRMAALREKKPLPPVPAENRRYFHLQARGGRGKSYVTKCVIAKALSMGLAICVSAFTGVAAILLPRGQTCHRAYGLMLDVSEPLPSPLPTGSSQGIQLGLAALHVIDEVECLHRYLFEASVDVTKRCVNSMWQTHTEDPFGGAMVIISGDWHQTLPISPGINNDDVTVNSLVRSSPIFANFTTTVLTEAERNKGDPEFDAWLGALSVNRADGPEPLEEGAEPPTARRVYVPEQAITGGRAFTDEDAALAWLFGEPPKAGAPRPALNPRAAMLCTLNKRVDAINATVLDRYVGGDTFFAHAAHARSEESEGGVDALSRTFATPEYMASMCQHGVPPATLMLKVGCVLLLTRNLLNSLGLVNGTRAVLLSVTQRTLEVETVPPIGSGQAPQRYNLPRITFTLTTPGGLRFLRRQFPVRLAYATTSNKGQGQTVLRVVNDTRDEAFAHGQAYVADSRTTSFANLAFLHQEPQPGQRPTFINVVLARALGSGVLSAEVRRRGGPVVMDVATSSEEEGDGEEEEAQPMARKEQERGRQRAFAFKETALSLIARRRAIHAAAWPGGSAAAAMESE